MTHPLRARVNTCANVALTNPCAKRKVLSLTKPRGQIYKTKSLGHYITHAHMHTQTHIYICTYIHIWTQKHVHTFTYIHTHTHIYGEMVDFGKSDKMIKISGKVDKWNTYNGFSWNVSFFIQSEKVLRWIKDEILLLTRCKLAWDSSRGRPEGSLFNSCYTEV